MKYRQLIVLSLMLITGGSCLAQTDKPAITEDFKPSTLNQPGQEFPQVNSQGYARFRIIAPEAKSVVVSLGLGGTSKWNTPHKGCRHLMGRHHCRTNGRRLPLLSCDN